jgi:hypothetical protein
MFATASKVMRCENLHLVMNMNERGNLQTGYVHKINWNFGILLWITLFFPYKSTTCAVPTLQTKLESDWNLTGICALNIGIPIYWNKFQLIGIGLESWNRRQGWLTRYLSYPPCVRPRAQGHARENKELVSKFWDKKIPPNLSTGRYGVRMLFSVVSSPVGFDRYSMLCAVCR